MPAKFASFSMLIRKNETLFFEKFHYALKACVSKNL